MLENAHVIHAIYVPDLVIERREYFNIKKGLGFVDELELPLVFLNTLREKWKKWNRKLKDRRIDFTYAYNEKHALIVITSPKDNFSKKEGIKWVKRRLPKAENIINNIERQLNAERIPEKKKRFIRQNLQIIRISDESANMP